MVKKPRQATESCVTSLISGPGGSFVLGLCLSILLFASESALGGEPSQGGDAEALLKKMQDALFEAPSVSTEVAATERMTVRELDSLDHFEGGLIVTKDGRSRIRHIRVQHRGTPNESKSRTELVSDGKRVGVLFQINVDLDQEKWSVREAPRAWREDLLRGFALLGLTGGFQVGLTIDLSKEGSSVSLSTVRLGIPREVRIEDSQSNDTHAVVMYTITPESGAGPTHHCTVWIDRRTGLPSKRTIQYAIKIRKYLRTETYKTWDLAGKLDGAQFKIPDQSETDETKRVRTRAVIGRLGGAVEAFKKAHGRYPEQLEYLINRPQYVTTDTWPREGYLGGHNDLKDGWGRRLIYRVPGSNGRPFDLGSFGAKWEEGGSGIDEDVWYGGRSDK